MNVYVLEGPDGVGKSTLANAINSKTKGHMLHCTWKKEWNMKEYFTEIMRQANQLSKYQQVVIDRWAPSEHVYGNVFRGGSSFDVFDYLWENEDNTTNWQFIICRNENVVENHKHNLEEREEMFDDMTEIAAGFDNFVLDSPQMHWLEYDYDKVDMNSFVNTLLGE